MLLNLPLRDISTVNSGASTAVTLSGRGQTPVRNLVGRWSRHCNGAIWATIRRDASIYEYWRDEQRNLGLGGEIVQDAEFSQGALMLNLKSRLTLAPRFARLGLCAAAVLAPCCPPGTALGENGSTFASNAQHTGNFTSNPRGSAVLNAIRWQTPNDTTGIFSFAHYGSPIVSAANTVIVPVLTSATGFRVDLFDGASATGAATPKFSLTTDYVLPSHNWTPTFQPVLAKHVNSSTGKPVLRLYYAGAGGTVYYLDNPDSATAGAPGHLAFYGLTSYRGHRTLFNSSVFINTPITADSQGNIYFGFRVQGTAPSPLSTTQSGFARITPAGVGSYVLAAVAAGDANAAYDSHNSAPALSNDESLLYVVVKGPSQTNAYLLALDAGTLATRYKAYLRDPRSDGINDAVILDDSTASPTVGPDGDVYFGVFSNPDNGSRGFLLHFNATLSTEKIPGGFGWDFTPAIVPASMVPEYMGTSAYLLFSKYNNYVDGDGNGVNRIALLDPNAAQIDPHSNASNLTEMREFLTVIGPTPDPTFLSPAFPYARREWCINTPAVDPATKSILTPSEDGHIYRWDLTSNSLSQSITLGAGVGEPYVPTIVGPDGTVITMNGGTVFGLGRTAAKDVVTINSSSPDVRTAVAGPFSLTAAVGGANTSGSVTVTDAYYPIMTSYAPPITSTLASRQRLVGGLAAVTAKLAAGTHFITATHDQTGTSSTRVQTVHSAATTTRISVSPSVPVRRGTPLRVTAGVTSAAGIPTGMVTFLDISVPAAPVLLAQLALNALGTASFTSSSLAAGTHNIEAIYASDVVNAASHHIKSVMIKIK